jgi:flavin reductase (DIM6/NTAB) family NADH-FMN oxidoreductase RutF
MQIDPARHRHADNYKLLTNLVVPRPIAWVSSLGPTGVINLAPFSFFNAVDSDPVYVIVSIGARDNGAPKDTAKNIESHAEFAINMVTEDLLEAMNISAADFPPDQSELIAADLHAAPSVCIRVPRLSEAQVSLECKLFRSLPLGTNTLYVGAVVMFRRRSFARTAIAHQRLRADRPPRFPIDVLSHHGSAGNFTPVLCRMAGEQSPDALMRRTHM